MESDLGSDFQFHLGQAQSKGPGHHRPGPLLFRADSLEIIKHKQKVPDKCLGLFLLPNMAIPIRFELTISSLTGRRVRPLHHGTTSRNKSAPIESTAGT